MHSVHSTEAARSHTKQGPCSLSVELHVDPQVDRIEVQGWQSPMQEVEAEVGRERPRRGSSPFTKLMSSMADHASEEEGARTGLASLLQVQYLLPTSPFSCWVVFYNLSFCTATDLVSLLDGRPIEKQVRLQRQPVHQSPVLGVCGCVGTLSHRNLINLLLFCWQRSVMHNW